MFTFLVVEVNKIGDFQSHGVYQAFGALASQSTDYPLSLLSAFLAVNGSVLAWVLPKQPHGEETTLYNKYEHIVGMCAPTWMGACVCTWECPCFALSPTARHLGPLEFSTHYNRRHSS